MKLAWDTLSWDTQQPHSIEGSSENIRDEQKASTWKNWPIPCAENASKEILEQCYHECSSVCAMLIHVL
jgi:hypothetical protein